ncbi:MAG TPA: hypothetical protein VGV86_04575 [Acidimicrobiales bacterium]|nr:hypothetical protein [Acidimicrobiales bacterium]
MANVADADTPDRDAVEEVERWFRSRGIPHFIDDYSATRDVFTRALPALTLILVLELLGALNFRWPWWLNLGVAAGSLGALLMVWALVNAARKRPALARPDRVGRTELAIFVLLVPILDLLAGGQHLTSINTLVGNLAFLGLIYLVTSYALLPITRWAAGRLWRQLGDLLGLLVRALPLLLLFVTFLFLTTEVWQVAASLDGPFLGLTMALFVAVGIVFVVARIPREVGALARFESWADVALLVGDTPAAALRPPSDFSPEATTRLGRRQWGNVGLVVLFTQGLQIVFVSVMIGVFFVGFGLLTVTPETAALWVGDPVDLLVEWEVWDRPVVLTAELLQVAGFLTAFSGFYFTVYVLTDATYRKEFLDEVLVELRQAFAVRALYLAARAGSHG